MTFEQRLRRILKAKVLRAVAGLRLPAGDGVEGPAPEAEEPPRPAPSVDEREARYRRVLEVSAGASVEEVRLAYRRLCKEYHPDRFAGAGEEKRAAANELLAEINAAYAYLTGKR